ncbi:protein of unknown function [Bradyrhizobium vignae]|uniref:Uncharacterized protein n=1 Tax=Bradyrhizobium vignae TaxID=1549949 RepID=A0A2U3PUG6_9BRAD|nr:protein of unknown function [Bradyrhizobium vignae]
MSDDTKQSNLNDHERRVYAKIVDDLSDLDPESQRHVLSVFRQIWTTVPATRLGRCSSRRIGSGK